MWRIRNLQYDDEQDLSRRWPEQTGYLDFITDVRDPDYIRYYHGQSETVIFRIADHLVKICRGKFETLHHYVLQLGQGHRRATMIRVWTIPQKLLHYETEELTTLCVKLLKNFLEMLFCGAFRSLPIETLVEYFGQTFTSQDQYSGLGLNVLPPLLQSKEMGIMSRSLHRARLLKSQDPEIQSWDKIRSRQVSSTTSTQRLKPLRSTQKATLEELLTPVVCGIRPTMQGHDFIRMLQESQTLPDADFSIANEFQMRFPGGESPYSMPVGSLIAPIGVVLDNMSINPRTSRAEWPWILTTAGLSTEVALSWTYNHTSFGVLDSSTLNSVQDSTNLCSEFSKALIENSGLKVILLCGRLSEQAITTSLSLTEPQVLQLRGQVVRIWVRDRTIQKHMPCQTLVSMPEPFAIGMRDQWSEIHKFGEVLKLASVLTSLHLDCHFFERNLAFTRVYRQAALEKLHRSAVKKMVVENLDAGLRAFLFRKGFESEDDLKELEQISGSLSRSICMLGHCFPKKPRGPHPRTYTKTFAPKTRSEMVPFPSTQYQKVRELYQRIVEKSDASLPAEALAQPLLRQAAGLPRPSVASNAAPQYQHTAVYDYQMVNVKGSNNCNTKITGDKDWQPSKTCIGLMQCSQ